MSYRSRDSDYRCFLGDYFLSRLGVFKVNEHGNTVLRMMRASEKWRQPRAWRDDQRADLQNERPKR
ncbi:MAG: hypothetical protein JNL67_16525 [Planctomycetaceae bacterium]|nr:hypothetical protein [Planctomycetaceae bacterium]